MKKPTIITELSSYSYPVYDSLAKVEKNVDVIIKHLLTLVPKTEKIQLFCRGTSGLTISTYLCKMMIMNGWIAEIAFIRKPGESSHGSTTMPKYGYKTIIVDDFVDSGATILEILRSIADYNLYDNDFNTIKNDGSFIIGIACKNTTKIKEKLKELTGLQFIIE